MKKTKAKRARLDSLSQADKTWISLLSDWLLPTYIDMDCTEYVPSHIAWPCSFHLFQDLREYTDSMAMAVLTPTGTVWRTSAFRCLRRGSTTKGHYQAEGHLHENVLGLETATSHSILSVLLISNASRASMHTLTSMACTITGVLSKQATGCHTFSQSMIQPAPLEGHQQTIEYSAALAPFIFNLQSTMPVQWPQNSRFHKNQC